MSRQLLAYTKDFARKNDKVNMDSLLETKIDYTYYQYQKELGLPLFVRADLANFEEGLNGTLIEMKFDRLSGEEIKNIGTSLLLQNSRLLSISEVSASVAKQLSNCYETDRYGFESITSNNGHEVYRFKNQVLMIYARYAREWKMGVFSTFGQSDSKLFASSILNRFLGLALAPFGIVGFWGVPVDEGVVILKQNKSNGEAIYLDVMANQVISINGYKKLDSKFNILKLSSTIREHKKYLSMEELFSFLSNNCTYLDTAGHNMAVRQAILKISKQFKSKIYPSENFRPRTDLNL